MRAHRARLPHQIVNGQSGHAPRKLNEPGRPERPGPPVYSDDLRTFRAHVRLIGWCNQLIGLKPRQIGIQSRVQPGTTNLYSEGLNQATRTGKRQRGDKPTEGPVVYAGPGLLGEETPEHGAGVKERGAGRGREGANDMAPRNY
jgi:hypothetical protein